MIERRFAPDTTVDRLSVHVTQSTLAARLSGDLSTNVQARDELNSSISDTLTANEQTDLMDIITWLDGGATIPDKLARWHRLESVLMLSWHGGPNFGTQALLKAAIENMIGGTLT